ncbi:MAG: tetratricopeptide repeat protein [Rhodoferax sp.]|nr:tetratricopeptide repeat protein [Rhodoferax sp.]
MASRNLAKDKRDFDRTLKEARIGHRESQYEIALMYANGVGVAQDFSQAIDWVRQSAERGFAPAQYLLATRFSAGEVVEQDDHQALKWLLKAAEQEHPKAIYKLARFYSTTHERAAAELCQVAAKAGVPQAQLAVASEMLAAQVDPVSVEQAFLWCKKAAEQGVAAAQCALADRYAQGEGVAQDIAAAYGWYRKAARQYHIAAQVAMARLDAQGMGRGGEDAANRRVSGSTNRRRNDQRWSQAGDAGDATAKYQLGLMYQNGWGVAQDLAQAQRWFSAAAQRGQVDAQLALARLLEADSDYRQALDWYQHAAAQAHPEAFAALGHLYWGGLGTSKDDFLGLIWTLKAVEAGQAQAIASLGQFAVAEPARIVQACLMKAAAGGGPEVQYALGHHFENAPEPERNRDAAFRHYQRAAEQGYALAQCALGLMYSEGKEVNKDMIKARDWFMQAADQGDAKAQWNLALMLISGTEGVKKDLKKAFVLCQKAALQGFAPAQASLGILYAKMEKPDKAAEWWQVAAEQGDPEAQFNLALAYAKGQGVAMDATLALAWLTKAAEQGVISAQSKLGLLYATGDGVAQDPIEAHKWFWIASQKGDIVAQANLAHSETLLSGVQLTQALQRAVTWVVAAK